MFIGWHSSIKIHAPCPQLCNFCRGFRREEGGPGCFKNIYCTWTKYHLSYIAVSVKAPDVLAVFFVVGGVVVKLCGETLV